MATIDPTHPRPGAEAPPAAETPADTVGVVWWVLLATGILTMLAGIAVLVWPGATLLVIAVLFGVWLVGSGIVRLIAAFADKRLSTFARVLEGLVGAVLVIAGVGALGNVVRSLATLILVIGVLFIIDGIGDLAHALSNRHGSRAWPAVTGLVAIAAGLVILSRPGVGLVTLVAVLSALLVLLGIARISAAFALRRLGTS
jgi:uncharacterized membrane protein HdeD (DUF308 family)